MAIQVASTIHAAVTLFVVKQEDRADCPKQYLQSPQGCILQRVSEDGVNGWLVMLDYSLDVGSTALACQIYSSADPPTNRDFNLSQAVLFHIDDRLKLIVTVGYINGEYKTVDQSFHALFFNYQANQQELYPVDLVQLPPLNPPPSQPIP
jgi:hypothetical protein